MSLEPPPQLVPFIAANVAYWREQTRDMTDTRYLELTAERQNLYLAVRHGVHCSQTWTETTELILQLFEFVEVQGYWWEWVQILEQAIQRCPVNEWSQQSRLLNRLGFLYRLSSQGETALKTHQKAQELAIRAGNTLEEAYAHFFLSDDYYALYQYSQAEQACTLALKGFQALGVTGPKLAAVFNTRGMIAHALGNYPFAEQNFAQAIAIWRTSGRETKQAHCMNNLAISLQAQGRLDEALRYLQKARDRLAASLQKLALIHIQLSLGSLYFSMENFIQAEGMFREVDRVYLHQVDLSYLAFTLNNLGNALLAQGRFEEAGTYLEQSMDHWRQLDDKMMLANTLGDLAKVRVRQGQVEAALPLYEEAIALLAGYLQNAWARKRYQTLLSELQALTGADEHHPVVAR